MARDIVIRGARQNNLKGLDLSIRTGTMTVVTGVSGSGKSSLVFDTLYAEGQRRYVETFSAYARQFLDRMDRPHVDAVEGVPPAIAIDQVNPVRTSRSTVGTMTEINDYLKLLYAHKARLYCRHCAREVVRHTPESIRLELRSAWADSQQRLAVAFPVAVPAKMKKDEVLAHLAREGFTRIVEDAESTLWVAADRFRFSSAEDSRVLQALETALGYGKGLAAVYVEEDGRYRPWRRFASSLTCPDCATAYPEPSVTTFSFNSPVGACQVCRGFGRIQGIDMRLVIPDETLSLKDGAVKPWMTPSGKECYEDMMRYAPRFNIRVDVPYGELTEREKAWVVEGEPGWSGNWRTQWYGVRAFFRYLETKTYKMHIAVLLSRYRMYETCPACAGARLKDEWLLWRVGDAEDAACALEGLSDFKLHKPASAAYSEEALAKLPGLAIYDVMRLPLANLRRFAQMLLAKEPKGTPARVVLEAMASRLSYLTEVGLGYLTLDRQSRTLSGGEVQRIALTTALGTSLVNTLFVLDEPSVGLHPRDMARIVSILKRIRDAGNTLVIVEHDPDVILEADEVIDMGPGAGEAGGEILFQGPPRALLESATLTASHLKGNNAFWRREPKPVGPGAAFLTLEGACEHNLKDITVRFPHARLSVITGVSGSGKSTLIENTLVPAIMQLRKSPTVQPGRHARVTGFEAFDDIVVADQSAIGRTSRSNPVSYVGAFDAIRALFVATETARMRGYTPGIFSFNSGDGRCPACAGNGFERVEMLFLSDVLLPCPECSGRRYRPEILEVGLERQGKTLSIADVLELTVDAACEFFAKDKAVTDTLEPLKKVGLGYLRLGQPLPTLSRGEAQRLKIAGVLAQKKRAKPSLYLFDEPTTGLHLDDIVKLMQSLNELVERGHTVIVIEHNLEVIAQADWAVDLGPEGGERGGFVVYEGPAAGLCACASSHTAKALLAAKDKRAAADPGPRAKAAPADAIEVRGAREHNLKDVAASIPHGRFTVVTGVSGSGKSTLAFDVIFREGQRRYLESLNAYARSVVQPSGKPDVDAIEGITPTVAIEQRTSRGGVKSTVATLTEIYHFLRLLYVKLGRQHCPDCGLEVESRTPEAIAQEIVKTHAGKSVELFAPLVIRRKGIYKDLAAWAAKRGYGELRVDGATVSTAKFPRLSRFAEHTIELPVGRATADEAGRKELLGLIRQALLLGKGTVSAVEGRTQNLYSVNRSCPRCARGFAELDPRLFSYNSSMGWCKTCLGTGIVNPDNYAGGMQEEAALELEGARTCPACAGARLNPTALAVRFADRSIAQMTAMTIDELTAFFSGLKLPGRQADLARDALAEIASRLAFLREVGLGYLTLDRAAPSLSGGEAQRIRLASQLGSNLQGVTYVLDEPTIGLHPRDNRLLIETLRKLAGKGNTLVVVEHDEDTIREADRVIDMGPGAGHDGGRVIASGTIAEIMRRKDSVTGRYLKEPIAHSFTPARPVTSETPMLEIRGANLHNLKAPAFAVPLGRLVVVTGVSGSGKSSFARGVLLPAVKAAMEGEDTDAYCASITGVQALSRVLEVDQTPIGKTPRSCPATYVGFMDDIRKVFSQAPQAREKGFGPARFSFNTEAGRCPECEGRGLKTVEMHFLPDVLVPCEACRGLRYNPETLSVKWKGKSIGEILAMDVGEALPLFENHARIHRCLALMQDIGLGYLTLGQSSPTLSGGEAQRIKLVTELSKSISENAGAPAGRTLYVLDEPTVGLHMADVKRLTEVLHRLVALGNTVLVIEHNLDVMAEADWIIDLGPEGGAAGGEIVACGDPQAVMRAGTHTGRALEAFASRISGARRTT